MIVVALCLCVASVIVAIKRHAPVARTAGDRGGPGRVIAASATVSTVGMGVLMLTSVFLPSFTSPLTATIGGVLLLVVLAMLAVDRMRAVTARDHQLLSHWQKCVVLLAIVDLGFMSVSALLMPAHGAGHVVTQSLAASAASAPLVGEAHHLVAGGVMIWAVLATWLACAAVLVVPAIRSHHRDGISHATCSGLMIAAMAALVVGGA